MEREIIFLRLIKGKSKKGENYYFIDYLNSETLEPKRDWLDAIDFAILEKKTTGKNLELKKVTAIFGVNSNDRVYVKDIK